MYCFNDREIECGRCLTLVEAHCVEEQNAISQRRSQSWKFREASGLGTGQNFHHWNRIPNIKSSHHTFSFRSANNLCLFSCAHTTRAVGPNLNFRLGVWPQIQASTICGSSSRMISYYLQNLLLVHPAC